MRASLIRHVDPWQDAARGSRYEGYLPVDRLPRLAAAASFGSPMYVKITFCRRQEAARRGAIEIGMEVNGRYEMICQRCLEPLAIESDFKCSVWVVRDEAAARIADTLGETIVSAPGERLELAGVVEEELLLALPFAPSHKHGTCALQSDDRTDSKEEGDAQSLPSNDGEFENERHEEERQGAAHYGAKVSGRESQTNKDSMHHKAGRARSRQDDGSGSGDSDGHGDSDEEVKRNPFAVLAALRNNTDKQS
jgi:uncharacterized protein